MSCDALFQLGMGSVLLNASQTEETFAERTTAVRLEAIDEATQSRDSGFAEWVVADLFRAEKRSRGNSAKALIAGACASVPTA